MIERERTDEIVNRVIDINTASEKYQLIHAASAIESIFQKKLQQDYQDEYQKLREQIKATSDPDSLQELLRKASSLNKESRQRVRIFIEYLSQIKPGSARIHRTESNNFQITLPKEFESIRNEDNSINFEILKKLRKLMAHELGHVALHSGILDDDGNWDPNLGSEEEAEFFAEKLIELRKTHNEELHMKI